MQQLVFVLGRESHLSVAEIAAVLGDGAEWWKAELSKEALVIPTPRHFEGEAREISHDGIPSNGVRSLAVLEMTEKMVTRLGGTIKIGEVWHSVAHEKTSEVDAGGETSGIDRKIPDVEEPASDVEERVDDAIGRYILDQTSDARKVHFGYSVYDLGGGTTRVREVRESLRRGAAAQKTWLAEHGRKVRWVISREPTLSSVIVAKNDLLPDRNGVEMLVLVGADRILLARTLAVQPFEEWGRRDYGRPSRDARSGMLPPKLARAMVNIALGRNPKSQTLNPKQLPNSNAQNVKGGGSHFVLLDPFCGSGTILTEAMMLGVPRIIGTDVSAEAVEDAKTNVAWMHGRKSFSPSREGERLPAEASAKAGEGEGSVSVHVRQCDVRRLSQCVRERVDAIVTEPYLGPSKPQVPTLGSGQVDSRKSRRFDWDPDTKSSGLQAELRLLYVDAFREFTRVLKSGGRIIFIVPTFRGNYSPIRTNRRIVGTGAHRVDEQEIAMDITRDVEQLGFRRIEPFPASLRDHPLLRGKKNLPYARPDQRVGRRILVFAFSPR